MDSPDQNPLPKIFRDIREKEGFFTTTGTCFVEFDRHGSDPVLRMSRNKFNEFSLYKICGEERRLNV